MSTLRRSFGTVKNLRAALALLSLLLCLGAGAQSPDPEERASRRFESIRHQPLLLRAFLHDMPKGGDLHNHLIGAVYAETLISYAADDGLCIDRETLALTQPPCDSDKHPQVSAALADRGLYRQIVNAFSMRDFPRTGESAQEHFFATFGKFRTVTYTHLGDFIAEVASRAADQNEQYLELMFELPSQVMDVGKRVAWTGDFDATRKALLASGLDDVVTADRRKIDEAEARMRARLKCGTAQADRGCRVTIRYISTVLRGLPPPQVFAQAVAGFELATRDPRFVSANPVMPEHEYVARHDFALHVQMFDYLHRIYPGVHITMHAGELWFGQVPPEDLRTHIRQSIELGHAERIGHGVDVMYESDPAGLLREMAERKVLVETNLTSNDVVLGVRGPDHPLRIYLQHDVPVALSTDDEGVSRSDLTHEYQRAVEDIGLGYRDLKLMARNSLEHAFLPGDSLWAHTAPFRRSTACAHDSPGTAEPSPTCRTLLASSARARVQWELEAAFESFEKSF